MRRAAAASHPPPQSSSHRSLAYSFSHSPDLFRHQMQQLLIIIIMVVAAAALEFYWALMWAMIVIGNVSPLEIRMELVFIIVTEIINATRTEDYGAVVEFLIAIN